MIAAVDDDEGDVGRQLCCKRASSPKPPEPTREDAAYPHCPSALRLHLLPSGQIYTERRNCLCKQPATGGRQTTEKMSTRSVTVLHTVQAFGAQSPSHILPMPLGIFVGRRIHPSQPISCTGTRCCAVVGAWNLRRLPRSRVSPMPTLFREGRFVKQKPVSSDVHGSQSADVDVSRTAGAPCGVCFNGALRHCRQASGWAPGKQPASHRRPSSHCAGG